MSDIPCIQEVRDTVGFEPSDIDKTEERGDVLQRGAHDQVEFSSSKWTPSF